MTACTVYYCPNIYTVQAGIARAENGMEEASSDTDRNMTVFFGLRSIGPPGLTFLTSRHPMFDVHISGRDIQIIYGIAQLAQLRMPPCLNMVIQVKLC